MEDLSAMWTYQESSDELKQKLHYMAYELESAKIQANEEIRKHKENALQLFNLLQIACQERDEAKAQLQALINKMIIPPKMDHHDHLFFKSSNSLHIPLSPQTTLLNPPRTNSSITESNSFCEAQNYSSSVDSFFDSVSSPDLSTIKNIPRSSNLGFPSHYPPIQDFHHPDSIIQSTMSSSFSRLASKSDPDHDQFNVSLPTLPKEINQDDMLINSLAKGKALPQKGRLLKAVMEAVPLLQTLMVAGQLPRWRNPPLQTGKRLLMGSVNDLNPTVRLSGSGAVVSGAGGNCSVAKRQRIER
ncbi:hypothetical protein AKJ16_DCAP07754 [Drosera capensis]